MRYEHTCQPIEVDGVTITPIAEVRLDATRWSHGLYVWGSVEAVAVLIRRNGYEARVWSPTRHGKRDADTPPPGTEPEHLGSDR